MQHEQLRPPDALRGKGEQAFSQLPRACTVRLLPAHAAPRGENVLVIEGTCALHERLAGQGRSGEIRGERQILRQRLGVELRLSVDNEAADGALQTARLGPQPPEQTERRLIHPSGACIEREQNARAAQVALRIADRQIA